MLTCSGCGSNLKFDIASQKLLCPYCESTAEPEALDTMEAKEDNSFDTMVFSCPQCGGELSGEENEAAVFCPYCGNSTLLEGRLTKKKRPNFIIPFKITKEQCISSYKKLLRRSIYAPDNLRKEGVIDSFRGIYIPYWYYTAKQNAVTNYAGHVQNSELSGGRITYYECHYKIDAKYEGITYDASELFDDQVSLAIAPFKVEERKEFAPGYMSGFYADTFDVNSTIYQNNAELFACQETLKKLKKIKNVKEYHISENASDNDMMKSFNTEMETSSISLMPVWFMSCKYGDRMAYASINGQTGKAAGMIPASPKKYVLFSLLTAIPLFFLINLVSFPRPEYAMMVANFIAMIVYLIYDNEINRTQFHEATGRIQLYEAGVPLTATPSSTYSTCVKIMVTAILGAIPFYYIVQYFRGLYLLADVALMIMMLLLTFKSIKPTLDAFTLQKRYTVFAIPVVGVISVIVNILNPVDDIYFYLMGALQIVASAAAFIDLIHYHNLLSTRSMPQFARTGGDDDAE